MKPSLTSNQPAQPASWKRTRLSSLALVAVGVFMAVSFLFYKHTQATAQAAATLATSRHSAKPTLQRPERAGEITTDSRSGVVQPSTTSVAPLSIAQRLQIIASDPTSEAAFIAARLLAEGGQDAEHQLIAALAQANTLEHARMLAAALAMNGSGDAVEAIWKRALIQPDTRTREALLSAFDNVTNPEGISLIASALVATHDPDVVLAATRTLARAATTDTVDFLAELYSTPARPSAQRTQILTALSAVTNPQAIAALGSLATRVAQPDLAGAAASSLAKSGTAIATLALSDAFHSIHGNDPESDALRQRLLENFAATRVTRDNVALITQQSAQSTSPAWQATAQRLVANSSMNTLATEGFTATGETAFYRPLLKSN